MATLLIALAAGVGFIVAYHTYGRWLGGKIFNLSADFVCPSHRLRDDKDYIPTPRPIVFGHHFTSIAGTGPIVGPAIAVMWGWLPALLWVVFGSIFIGAVHDFGALVVSLRNNGQTVGDIAGRMLNTRVRLLFLFVLFMALTIVLAIFGLVIAAVFKQYPTAIFPCVIQIPIAVVIGLWLHRKGVNLTIPSLIALGVMYLTVIYGDVGLLHTINSWLAERSMMWWVIVLLIYSYIASVLPVWTLLQPRDYINSLQLLTALGLIVVGLFAAAFIGGAPPVEGAERQPLRIVAPVVDWHPSGAPLIFPFLFITIACGAISGFHCLVSSGTSSKQLEKEPDARFVGYGSMLTEGFLATLVICACVAGLGLGNHHTAIGSFSLVTNEPHLSEIQVDTGNGIHDAFVIPTELADAALSGKAVFDETANWGNKRGADGVWVNVQSSEVTQVGVPAWFQRYQSWGAAGSLAAKVGAFVDGSANFLMAIGVPAGVAIALMGVLVASFAGTTLDTACRLQRYVVQELAATFLRGAPHVHAGLRCLQCGYDLTGNVSGKCPECGWEIDPAAIGHEAPHVHAGLRWNPMTWFANKHGATLFAIVVAAFIAYMPVAGASWAWDNAGRGGLILWPLFGATNQLLGGLAFLVIGFYLLRRRKPIWFMVLPLLFMLVMPAWAMALEVPRWWDAGQYVLVFIAAATLVLEAWMIVEALLLWPKVRGVLEAPLPGDVPATETVGA